MLCLVCTAPAWGMRAAFVFSANAGDAGEARLRFADSDARAVMRVLKDSGSVAPEDAYELSDATADGVRRLLDVIERAAAAKPYDVLTVYYSGHADASMLHLSGTRLGMEELKRRLGSVSAKAKVLVLDACRSGGATRVKGGRTIRPFEVIVEAPVELQGLAVLTSSAQNEDSLESDELHGSFFTHALVSGLLGAADRDLDGAVTLEEAFEFARQRTVAKTEASSGAIQHPTYEFSLRGRQSLVWTWPFSGSSSTYGVLRFEDVGHFSIRRTEMGPVVAEVVGSGPRRLRVVPGSYLVTERRDDSLRQGRVEVHADGEAVVQSAELQRVEYARAARKGGSSRNAAFSLVGFGSARATLSEFPGWVWGGALTGRLDLQPLALEIRLAMLPVMWTNERLTGWSSEFQLGLGAFRAFDFRFTTFSLGVETGPLLFFQRFNRPEVPPRSSLGWLVGPVFQADTVAWNHVFIRGEMAVTSLIFLRQSSLTGARESVVSLLTARFSLGLGVTW